LRRPSTESCAEHAAEALDFILIPGDLTIDAELASHEGFSTAIARLEEAGVPVLVVPGNHDVNNPQAVSFDGDDTVSVPTVGPDEFAAIYAGFGYDEAFDRDPHSLSYVVEPVEGLWVIGMDSAIYDHNVDHSTTGGAFSAETLDWILDTVSAGADADKTVIGMMHHGIREHYVGQSLLFAEYLLTGWEIASQQLAEAGMHVVFTGQYHSQDITVGEFDGTLFYDVETGSLVTFPCPYRIIELEGRSMDIESFFISEVPGLALSVPFTEHAEAFLLEGITGLALALVQAPIDQGGFGLTPRQADIFAPHAAAGFMAHYAGEEIQDPTTMLTVAAFMISPEANVQQLGLALGSLYSDLPPADNAVIIDW